MATTVQRIKTRSNKTRIIYPIVKLPCQYLLAQPWLADNIKFLPALNV
jgi:hypothetical protein